MVGRPVSRAGSQEHGVRGHVVEPADAAQQMALDGSRALHLDSERGEERARRAEVVDDDA